MSVLQCTGTITFQQLTSGNNKVLTWPDGTVYTAPHCIGGNWIELAQFQLTQNDSNSLIFALITVWGLAWTFKLAYDLLRNR